MVVKASVDTLVIEADDEGVALFYRMQDDPRPNEMQGYL